MAAPASTGDYGLDVHIDLSGLGGGVADTIVQDFLIAPFWMGLVWAVHALIVMLEWCFGIDLLDSSTSVGLGSGLRAMQSALTEPWLPIALALASMLALYHGIVRRRVAQTLGDAALMIAMMVAGLWIVDDPTGTVGPLGQWASQASLGTLAVAAHGSPRTPGRALGASLGALFGDVVEAPWCYLEFGAVSWCRDPAQLDPALRRAARAIAADELAHRNCTPLVPVLPVCERTTAAQRMAFEHSAQLLRDARTNGAIFLALPANGVARNSINESGSLLRTLCGSSDASGCRGPTAAQAEFRTIGGTLPRLGGLLLIGGGLIGMLLLLGFLAVRLLLAAVFSLLYLLLAPAVVLAPAFGEDGRALFRRWGGQLLGAVVAKLVFAFVLGVVLAVLSILSELTALGWWTQWLLMSAFWWGAFVRRHQALGVAGTAFGNRVPVNAPSTRAALSRRLSAAVDGPREGIAMAKRARARLSKPGPDVQHREQGDARMARKDTGEQAERVRNEDVGSARQPPRGEATAAREVSSSRAQLERIEEARVDASASGDRGRAAELSHCAEPVSGELAAERRSSLDVSERADMTAAPAAHGLPGRGDARERFLDGQAALPSAGRPAADGGRRDYAALAGLVGHSHEGYEQLSPVHRRAARVEIDRELAKRAELARAGEAHQGPPRPPREPRDRERVEREPSAPRPRSPSPGAPRTASESPVMRDAREVAAGRKRQLGYDRP